MNNVKLFASAGYGCSGQYIARLKGRNEQFTFERVFVGTRYGKRNESSSHETDESGIYECRSVDKKGKHDEYYIVAEFAGELHRLLSDKADCMVIARALDAGRKFSEIVNLSGEDDGRVLYEILEVPATVSSPREIAIAQAKALIAAHGLTAEELF